MTTPDYTYWREAMAGRFGPVHDGHPQPGFYRCRVLPGRDTPWTPVAIWPDDDGHLLAIKHMYVVEAPLIVAPDDVWTFCCDYPISEAAYRAVAEHKQMWPEGSLINRRKTA